MVRVRVQAVPPLLLNNVPKVGPLLNIRNSRKTSGDFKAYGTHWIR